MSLLATLLALGLLAADQEKPVTTLTHPLPDPLVMLDGTRVKTPAQWYEQRRPELKRLFQQHIFGHLPPAPAKVEATLRAEDPRWLGGAATVREVLLRFGPADGPTIKLLLAFPNHRQAPAGVFLGMNFYGNHTLCASPIASLPDGWVPDGRVKSDNHHANENMRMSQPDNFPFETVLKRGYALATFYAGDTRPDRAEPKLDGVQLAYPAFNFATIAAWAWSLQRCVDYLVTVPELDAKKIAVVGHSRNGKAAMLAGAFDERISLTIPVQAGCGGTAPARGNVGEMVKRINTVFPHWFCARFKDYNDKPERLPIDFHELMALCAPRALLLSCATADTWANPQGQFECLQAADKVYRFLGVDGLSANAMPAENKLVDSRLGFFIRPAEHKMDLRDWPAFLDFADKQWGPGK